MNIVKCPNPTCPFQFDAALVPPGAVIACPQCRLQFQLPAAHTAPPQSAPPPAESPDFDPTAGREGDDVPSPRTRTGRTAAPTKGGGIAVLIAVLIAGLGLLCCGGVVGGGFLLGWFKGKPSDVGDYRFPDHGLTLNGPGDGWEKDEQTREKLGVNLIAFKRTGPEGCVAVHARKTTSDSAKGELLPAAKELLEAQFEDLDETFIPAEAKLLGYTGERYEFSGRYKATGTGCRGEVYAVVARNTLVWVYTWADRQGYDQLAPAFDTFRSKLKLDAPKTDKVTRPATEYRSASGLFTVTDAEALWKKQPDPKIKDEKGELLLYGFRRSASGTLGTKEEAYLVVAVLDPAGDAKEQARKYIEQQSNGPDEVNELEGLPEGDPPSSGPLPPSEGVTRLTLKYGGKSTDGLVAFATADAGGKRVVAYARAPLKQRSYWEQRLVLLVGSLKAK